MKKDVFSERLISLLAVQDGLIPASAIGLTIKQRPISVKSQLKVENIIQLKKGGSHVKSK